MATYPDGTSPHMQMYLTETQGGQSTGLDSSVIYHEYTHGLVGRSIVDADGVDAAGGAQGGAINEGTADWFAEDYIYSTASAAPPRRRCRWRPTPRPPTTSPRRSSRSAPCGRSRRTAS